MTKNPKVPCGAIEPEELEKVFSVFYDTKKMLHYCKGEGWAWSDMDEVTSTVNWHRGFATAWEAMLSAVEPYMEDDCDDV